METRLGGHATEVPEPWLVGVPELSLASAEQGSGASLRWDPGGDAEAQELVECLFHEWQGRGDEWAPPSEAQTCTAREQEPPPLE